MHYYLIIFKLHVEMFLEKNYMHGSTKRNQVIMYYTSDGTTRGVFTYYCLFISTLSINTIKIYLLEMCNFAEISLRMYTFSVLFVFLLSRASVNIT